MAILTAVVAVTATACGSRQAENPQIAFWAAIRSLCGQSFKGRLAEASIADSAALAAPLVLDVWQCYAREMRLAFHVGDDRSRVWLLSTTNDGLALKHALHDPNGDLQPFSGYGGVTTSAGTATTQVFRPDDETVAKVPSAAGTEWIIEVVPGERITYRLRSAAAGDFRIDFDLNRRAGHQPAPWGFTRR